MSDKPLSLELTELILKKHGRSHSPGDDLLQDIRELEPALYPSMVALKAYEESHHFIRKDMEMKIKSPDIWQIQLDSSKKLMDKQAAELLESFSSAGFDIGSIEK